MTSPSDFNLEKEQIARQFSRSAATYDQVAALQRTMSEHLIAKIPLSAKGTLVDFGCGTGHALGLLLDRTDLNLIGIDIAPGMIEVARRSLPDRVRLIQADFEKTGLDSASVDIVFSNAALQWTDLPLTLAEINRILRPPGKLLVSTFGPATMVELKKGSEAIGDRPRVHQFMDQEQIGIQFERAGFRIESIESNGVVIDYDSAEELFRAIKQLGGTNAMAHRDVGLMGKERYRKLVEYLEQTRSQAGKIGLTYEAIFVAATRKQSVLHLPADFD